MLKAIWILWSWILGTFLFIFQESHLIGKTVIVETMYLDSQLNDAKCANINKNQNWYFICSVIINFLFIVMNTHCRFCYDFSLFLQKNLLENWAYGFWQKLKLELKSLLNPWVIISVENQIKQLDKKSKSRRP